MHANAGGEAEGHEAMLVTLQCMHALMSGAGGMHAVMSTRGFLPAVCAMLALPQESEAAKLVVEMLIKLSLFSAKGYTLAVKVPSLSYLLTIGGEFRSGALIAVSYDKAFLSTTRGTGGLSLIALGAM